MASAGAGDAGRVASGSGKSAAPARTLSVLGLAVLAYVNVCGGPFGIEEAVSAAGTMPALIGIAGVAIFWCVPQAMMTAELSSMFKKNGGYIAWSFVGLSPFWGFMCAANSILANQFDLPLYPVLVAAYSRALGGWAENGVVDWVLKGSCLLVVVAMNVLGLEIVAFSSLFFVIAVLLPFVIQPFLSGLDAEAWEEVRGKPDWALYASALLWNVQGWDSLGTVAGEVMKEGYVYPVGVGIALGMMLLTYIVPILTATSIDPSTGDWDDGEFARIGVSVAPWLGTWIGVGASLSAFSEFNAVMATSARALQCTAGFGMGPKLLSLNWNRTKTPTPAILAQAVVCLVLMSFQFDELVIMTTILNNVSLLIEMAAFVRMRYSMPDTDRPCTIPGGLVGAWTITVPKVLIVLLSFATLQPSWQLYVGIGANLLFALLAFFWARRLSPAVYKRMVRQWGPPSKDDGESTNDQDRNEGTELLVIPNLEEDDPESLELLLYAAIARCCNPRTTTTTTTTTTPDPTHHHQSPTPQGEEDDVDDGVDLEQRKMASKGIEME